MKKFLIIVLSLTLCLMLATMAGWLTFSHSGDQANVTIDKKEIQGDTRGAIDAGKDLLDKASEEVRGLKDGKAADNNSIRQ